jgi:transposase
VRAYGKVPRNRGRNLTLIAALTWRGMGEPILIEGSANTGAFEQSIEKMLAPTLTVGQIVLMDTLTSHKSAQVKEVIQARGCQLLFLPRYSPDFSPIEDKLKHLSVGLGLVRRKQYTRSLGSHY